MECAATFESPLGRLVLVSDGTALTALLFDDERVADRPGCGSGAGGRRRPFPQAARELREYFAGRRTGFDVPIVLRGTPFQRRVWEELRHIPYGAAVTYGEIARAVGSPGAVRAVGAACARNPLPIVVPCHRVIGADGALTGYAGGLTRKRALLGLEAASVPRKPRPPRQ